MIIVLAFLLCIFIVAITPRKMVFWAFLLSSLIISALAFNLSTVNQYDLIFHLELYDALKGKGISAAVEHYFYSKSPLYVLYVWVLGFLGDNRFLPAISTFISYFSISMLIYGTAKKFNLTKQRYVSIYMFILCALPWHDFAAGIRGALSFVVCGIALYLDFSKTKKQILSPVLYIASIFIHQSAIVFILVRLLVAFVRKRSYFVAFLFFGVFAFINVFPIQSYNILVSVYNSTGFDIFYVIAQSYESYMLEGKDLYEYSVVLFRAIAILLIFIISFFSNQNMDNKYWKDCYEKKKAFFTILLFLTLILIWQYDAFCRYAVACIIISPIVLASYERATFTIRVGKYRDDTYKSLLFLFSLVNLGYYYLIYYSKWVITF